MQKLKPFFNSLINIINLKPFIMKKSLLLLSLMLIGITLTTFARTQSSNDPRAEQEFEKQFAGASNVKWANEQDGYLSVSFTWAGHRTIAYFNSDGHLAGSARGLFFNQLPLNVMRSFNNQFQNSIILEIREISNAEGVRYIILLENNDKKYKIRYNNAGDLLEKEKIKN